MTTDFNNLVNKDVYYYVVSDIYGTKITNYFRLPGNIHILQTEKGTFWKYEKQTDSWYQVNKIGENKYRKTAYSRGCKNYLKFGYHETVLDPNF